jgi:hypothetical protein
MIHSINPLVRIPGHSSSGIDAAPHQTRKTFTRETGADGRDGNRIQNFMHRVQTGFTRSAHQSTPVLQASMISGPFPHIYPAPGVPVRFPAHSISPPRGADIGPSVPRNTLGYPLGVSYEVPHLHGNDRFVWL